VTAVASSDDEGEQPSRFLEELFPEDDGHRVHHVAGRPARPLSLPGLVAELRRTVADPNQPEPLRRAAALRLARLAEDHRAGRVRVPAADPATWWGTRSWTAGDQPLRPAAEPVVISASTLTSVEQCPAKWFLEREGGGERPATQAQGFGNVVHSLADRIGRGDVQVAGRAPADVVDELMDFVDTVWGQIPFRTPWSGESERREVRAALLRFLARHTEAGAREVIGTEQRLRAEVTLPDGERVLLHGYADRVELDAAGRVVVVDLKTGKSTPSKEEIRLHPQLGLYQLAVEHGAVPGHDAPGGAELWQLRQGLRSGMRVQEQAPQVADDEGVRPIERQLMAAVARLRDEQFPARPGAHCTYCDFERFCPARTSGTVLS
jgi:RecB family exonuclease